MKKTGIIIAVVIALALTLGGFGYYNQVYLPAQATATPAYNTTKVRSGDILITADGVGNILPSESVSVGFQVNGIVAELNVKVGDEVEVGQVLAKLDDTNARLRLQQAELSYNTFYSQSSLQQAQIDQLNAKSALEDAGEQLEYLISPDAYYWEKRLETARAELTKLQSTPGANESELEAAQKEVDKAQSYLIGAQQEYYETYVWEVFPYTYKDETTGEVIETYLEPTKDAVTEARLKVGSAELALLDAETYLIVLEAGRDAELEVVVADSGSKLAKLEDARLDLELAQAAFEDTMLTAPVSGTVTSLSANVGQAIGTNPFLSIETLDQMVLRFYVEESDIHMVKIGNPVNITFDAYPDNVLEGQITYLEPALQTVDGNPAAVVWASLPENNEIQLLSGMSADVEVIAGESRGTLLVPVQSLRELAPGSYAVFKVQPDGSLALTPVTVGLMDYANAEILSGLTAGDVISTGAVETK
ncbi:MAG: efflux RND transporter periplasmic adaptor subunit [Bellilinea sp.]